MTLVPWIRLLKRRGGRLRYYRHFVTRSRRRPRYVRLELEILETRTVLSTFTISGGIASFLASTAVVDTITMSRTGTFLQINDTGDTIGLSQDAVTAGSTGDGSHTILCPAGAVVSLNIVNSAGTTNLVVDESADTTARSATLTDGVLSGFGPGLDSVTFAEAHLQSLVIDGGDAANTFLVSGTPDGASTQLNTGSAGAVVNLTESSARGPLMIAGQGGADQVNLGAGLLAGIVGKVSLTNRGALTTLTVDDSKDVQPTHGVLGAGQITGANLSVFQNSQSGSTAQPFLAGEIDFDPAALAALAIKGGGGGNVFVIPDTGSGYTTSLDSGTGQDIVDIEGTTGPLSLDGQDGRDLVSLGDWQTPPTSFTNPGSTLANINGPIQVTNDHSLSDIEVDDGGDTVGQTATLAGNTLTGLGMGPNGLLTFNPDGVNSLTLKGGSGGNQWTLSAPASGRGFVTTIDTTNAFFGDTVQVSDASGIVRLLDPSGTDQVLPPVASPYFQHILGESTLALNSQASATLQTPYEVDSFPVTIDQEGYLNISLTAPSSTFAGRLSLFNNPSFVFYDGVGNGGGGLLSTSDATAPGATDEISQYVLPGQYYVQVSSTGAGTTTGAYTLSAAFSAAANPYTKANLPPLEAVGANPQDIIEADFTGNGILDLATVNAGSQDVSVLLGNGDGTFQSQKTFPVYPGDHPTYLAAVDVNGDGRLDIVTWDPTDHRVSVLLGLGDGTFLSGTHALSMSDTDFLSLLPGHPSLSQIFAETFVTVSGFGGTGTQTVPGVVGDFNRDGNPDLAFLQSVSAGVYASDLVVSVGITPGGGPAPGLAAIVNLPDLTDKFGGPISVESLLTQGDGIEADRNFSNTSRATPLAGYLTGNGVLDVVEASDDGRILLREGVPGQPGVFGAPEVINDPVADPAREIVILSQDPNHPQIAAIALGSSRVFVLTGTLENGVMTWQVTFTAVPDNLFLPLRIAAGDLDGNGHPDLVIANELLGSLAIYLNNGDGTFRRAPDVKVGITISDIAVSDPQNTGHADVLVTDQVSGDVDVLINAGLPAGSVAFKAEARYQGGIPDQGFGTIQSAASVIANSSIEGFLGGLPTSFVALYLGVPLYHDDVSSDLLFPPLYFSFSPLQTSTAAVGDFFGDGVPDLVVLNRGADSFSILRGTGTDGSFGAPQAAETFATGLIPTAVAIGDFTGDGTLDLAILNEGDPSLSPDQGAASVWIFRRDGHGGFVHSATYNAGSTPTGLTTADVTGNGHLDLLVGNTHGDLLVLLGRGDGTFRPPNTNQGQVSLAVTGPDQFLLSNQTGDRVLLEKGVGQNASVVQTNTQGILAPGRPAVVTTAGISYALVPVGGANELLVYPFVNGQPDLSKPVQTLFTGTDPVSVTIADLNGDSIPDVIVANKGSNDISVFFGRGTGATWALTYGQRLNSGGVGPVATAVDQAANGRPEILVSNSDSNTVATLPGVGDGFFNDQNVATLPVGLGPVQILPGPGGSFLTINSASDTITQVTNGIASTFPAGGAGPVAAIEGDFLSNGFTDLIVADNAANTLALLLGGPSGFTPFETIPFEQPTDLAFGGQDNGQLSIFVTRAGEESVARISFNLDLGIAIPGEPTAAGPNGNVIPATFQQTNLSSLGGTGITVVALVTTGRGTGAGDGGGDTPLGEDFGLIRVIVDDTVDQPANLAPASPQQSRALNFFLMGVDRAEERIRSLFREQALPPEPPAIPGPGAALTPEEEASPAMEQTAAPAESWHDETAPLAEPEALDLSQATAAFFSSQPTDDDWLAMAALGGLFALASTVRDEERCAQRLAPSNEPEHRTFT